MSAKPEYVGLNQKLLGIVVDELEAREPHMEDMDVAQAVVSQLHDDGLVVVDRAEWEIAKALVDAVRRTG